MTAPIGGDSGAQWQVSAPSSPAVGAPADPAPAGDTGGGTATMSADLTDVQSNRLAAYAPPPEPPKAPKAEPAVIDRLKGWFRKDPAQAPAQAPATTASSLPAGQQELYASLTPAQQQAFGALPPEGRRQFNDVYGRLSAGPKGPQSQQELKNLLESGRLSAKDGAGTPILETLDRRLDEAPDLRLKASSADVIRDVVSQLNAPDSVYQGKNTSTCASSGVQTILASTNPAEFVRVATGLAYDGKVTLASGKEMALDLKAIPKGDDRSALNQAVQGSFQAFASQYGEDGSELGGGKLGGAARLGGGKLGGRSRYGGGDEGLTENQIGRLYENLIGAQVDQVDLKDPAVRDSNFQSLVGKFPGSQAILVGVKSDIGHHAISVVGVDGSPPDNVLYVDPNDGKINRMPYKEFKEILEVVMWPTDKKPGAPDTHSSSDDPYGGGRLGSAARRG